jgi:hypothetical protein
MKHINYHVFVNTAGDVCEHRGGADRWRPPDWREEQERQRGVWRERNAWSTPPAAPAVEPEDTWIDGFIKQFYSERKQGFVKTADGGAHSNLHFARSAVEGEFTDEDLVSGCHVRFTVEPDVAPHEGKLRVARLVLVD